MVLPYQDTSCHDCKSTFQIDLNGTNTHPICNPIKPVGMSLVCRLFSSTQTDADDHKTRIACRIRSETMTRNNPAISTFVVPLAGKLDWEFRSVQISVYCPEGSSDPLFQERSPRLFPHTLHITSINGEIPA